MADTMSFSEAAVENATVCNNKTAHRTKAAIFLNDNFIVKILLLKITAQI